MKTALGGSEVAVGVDDDETVEGAEPGRGTREAASLG